MKLKEIEQLPYSKVFFTSLGCSKNLVDSQVMLGILKKNGLTITQEVEEAEVIIVNTCSFIDLAKQESIDTILELSDYKEHGQCKALVVSGCLAQRYHSELEKEMPEVDLFIGTGEYFRVHNLLKAQFEGTLTQKSFVDIPRFIHTEFDPRLNTSPGYMAWLKVSEGCNRNCTFCIIPTLRGRLRSRSVQSLVEETKNLVSNGVKEINIISQDLSDYGVDLDSSNNLVALLKELEKIEGLKWVRLFYFYPDELDDEMIATIKESKKVCAYLDMPIQHFSNSVLKRMNRKITQEEILSKVKKLRTEIPHMVLRTSVIVGFPGETEEDFQDLLKGVEQVCPEHLGVFKYSDEEGTPSFRLKDKIPYEVIEKRYSQVYEKQLSNVINSNKAKVGQTLEVLIEGEHPETDTLIVGRHYGQGPDIDGKVILNDSDVSDLKEGDMVLVKITEAHDYDLIGTVLSRSN